MTGATGFIGGALARALLAQGHELLCAVRDPARLDLGPVTSAGGRWQALRCDLAQVPDAAYWRPHLAGVDAVINAVGILRESRGQTFDALHARAPMALFEAAAQVASQGASSSSGSGAPPRVIQISALGADEGAQSRYHRSKKQADDFLRSLFVSGAVVQPSAVYGPGSEAAVMFDRLSALPLLAMPQSGGMLMQPVHLDDVVAGVLALLQARPLPMAAGAPGGAVSTVAFVGPRPLTMANYLRELRAARGNRWPLPVLWMPTFAFLAMARLASLVPGSVLDAETAGMLLRGNAAPVDDFQRLLGRSPKSVAEFLAPGA